MTDAAEFDLACPACGTDLVAAWELVGSVQECPACHEQMRIVPPIPPTDQPQRPSVPLGLVGRGLDWLTKGWYGDYRASPATLCAKRLHRVRRQAQAAETQASRARAGAERRLNSCWEALRQEARENALRAHSVQELMQVSGVGKVTVERLRAMGIGSMADLSRRPDAPRNLRRITGQAVWGIQQHLRVVEAAAAQTRPRLDPENPLVRDALLAVLQMDAQAGLARRLSEYRHRLDALRSHLPKRPLLGFFTGRVPTISAQTEAMITTEVDTVEDRLAGDLPDGYLDFQALSTDEYLRGMGLMQTRFGVPGEARTVAATTLHLGTPTDAALIQRIQSCQLDTSMMSNCILRRYQEFGAKFMLVAGHSFLGDEMGLGKTIQTLAAMGHVAGENGGRLRAMVVVPAGLRENWRREITRKTTLTAYMLAGAERFAQRREWLARGGVAVISYDTLRTDLDEVLADVPTLDFVVADEAQYVKNAGSQRSQATRALFKRAKRSVVMTGTPIENRPEDFAVVANTVAHGVARLRRIEQGAGVGDPETFKAEVQAVYLRRNKEDVLDELPGLVEAEEWVELGPNDLSEHLALMQGHGAATGTAFWAMLMKLRQHAIFAGGEASPKLQRVQELVEDYVECGRNVVVFTFFRGVISHLAEAYPDAHIIHGGIPAVERSAVVDAFSAPLADGRGRVLLSQIIAGGLGLNMQAGSVAILVEPQLNPAIEYQAMCRLHRMGQRRSVNVHRVLAKGTVEEGLYEMLARKRRYMELYARDSLLKEGTADAVSKDEVAGMLRAQSEELRKALAAA